MKVVIVMASILLNSILLLAETGIHSFIKKYEATGFVNDYANILSDTQQNNLAQKINAINDSTSIQFAICTVKSLEGYKINDFAKALGNFWGVGHQQLNNGVLLVTTVSEREIYIALGKGAEKYIEENYLSILIKEVIKPAFVKGNFANGFNNGIEKIYLKLRGSGVDMRAIKTKQKNNRVIYGLGTLLLLSLIVFLFFKMRS